MIRIYCTSAIFLLFFACAQAQTIRVLDKQTQLPVGDVVILDEIGYHTLTNTNGQANITELADGLLTFRHLGYETLLIPKGEVSEVVELSQATVTFDEVVISANKWEQDLTEIPVSVMKVSREDIAFNNPQTAADLLGQSGEVFIQKSQLGGGSPMIRGFAANSVLISIDGVRMNNAIYRSGNLQNVLAVDGLTTENAEVVFGPGSVIYGSDALGGVMDFHTIEAQYDNISGEAFGRFSSADMEKTGHVKFNVGNTHIGFSGAFTYSDFDDLVTGSKRTSKFPDFGTRPEYVDFVNGVDSVVQNSNINKQVYSGYSQYNALAKLKVKLTGNASIAYAFHYTNSSDVPRYDRLTEYRNGELRYAEWYYGPQKWLMHHLQFKSDKETGFSTESKLTFAYQQVEESRHDRRLYSPELRHRTENVDVLSLNADLYKEYFKSTIYYGVEMVYNKVGSIGQIEDISSGTFTPTSSRYPDGGSTWASLAAYTNLKYYFSTSLILNAGIRYSQVFLKSIFDDKTFYNFPYNEINIQAGAFNGSLGLVWKLGNELNIKTSLSSGFRAPNVDDVGKVFDSEPGSVVVPNEGLKPEYSYSGELTLTGKINYELEYSLTGYYTWLADAMVRRDFTFNGQDSILYDGTLSNVQAIVNAGKAYVAGVSGGIKYVRGAFSASSTLTYTTGQDVSDDVPWRYAPPVFGQTSVSYQWKGLKTQIVQRYNGAIPFDRLAPSEQSKAYLYSPDGTLAWTTTSLNLQYAFNSNLVLTGGVENIFDVHYRPYSSGISAPGRNFILSLRAGFDKK